MGYKVKHIYCGTNLVRPVWKPGANTLAYYPLTSSTTTSDMSGNNKTMTNNNSVTFGTYQGVSCASFNGTNQYLSRSEALFTGNAEFTTSSWIYLLSAHGCFISIGTSGGKNGYATYINDSGILASGGWDNDVTTTYYVSNNTWHNIITTHKNGTIKLYVDGILVYTGTVDFNITNTRTVIGRTVNISGVNIYNGYISESIIESKEWASAECKSYYNQTKSNYGL